MTEQQSHPKLRSRISAYGNHLPEGRKIQESFLSCGAKLLTRRVLGAPCATFFVLVKKAGSASEFEGNHKRGLSHLMEHLGAFETESYSKWEIDKRMMALGGVAGATTVLDAMLFKIKIPRHAWREGAYMISDMVCRPIFPPPAVAVEAGLITGEILKFEMDAPLDTFKSKALQLSHGNHPSLGAIDGDYESVLSITQDDLNRFRAEKFVAESVTIIGQGALDHGKVAAYFEKHFSLPRGKEQKASLQPRFTDGDHRFPSQERGVRNSISFPMGATGDYRKEVHGTILNAILHHSANPLIRDQARVYDFNPAMISTPSLFFLQMLYTGFNPSVGKSIEIIGQTLQTLAAQGDPKQLELRKAVQAAAFRKNPQISWRDMDALAYHEARFGRQYAPHEYNAMYAQTTNEDIKALARDLLSGPMTYCAQGAVKGLPSPSKVRTLLGAPPIPRRSP